MVQTAGAFWDGLAAAAYAAGCAAVSVGGVGAGLSCLGFVFGVFQQPAVALLPMIVLFTLYASRLRLPGRIPPALVAIGIGAGLVALMRHFHWYEAPAVAGVAPGFYLPRPVNVFALFGRGEWWSYLTIILPLGALDTLASLQILESVKAAGDDFKTTPSLLMNGVGTLAAACLGSPFPTTLYVGHAAHKANGARVGVFGDQRGW